MVGGKGKQIAEAMLLGPFLGSQGRSLRALDAKAATERVELVARLVEEGKLRTVIDRVYPLAETAQALRELEQGHAKGKIVIRVRE